MKKRCRAFLVLLLAALVLSGCTAAFLGGTPSSRESFSSGEEGSGGFFLPSSEGDGASLEDVFTIPDQGGDQGQEILTVKAGKGHEDHKERGETKTQLPCGKIVASG